MYLRNDKDCGFFNEFQSHEYLLEELDGDEAELQSLINDGEINLYADWEAKNCQAKKVKCVLSYADAYSVVSINPYSFMEYDKTEHELRDRMEDKHTLTCKSSPNEMMVIYTRKCGNGLPNLLTKIFLNKFILEDALCFYVKDGELVDFPEEKLKQYTK